MSEESLIDKEKRLAEYTGPDEYIDSDDARKLLEQSNINILRFNTGFSKLEDLVQGVEGGELIVVGGKTKQGKTLFCQSLTRNFHRQGHICYWLSYEVQMPQFLRQMEPAVRFGFPKAIIDRSLSWLEDKFVEARIKGGCQIMFIDHLHFLIDIARTKNPSLEIGSVVRGLKRLANKYNIVVFLICHVKDAMPGAEITEEHLRDSRLTACEADTSWIISRKFDKVTGEASTKARILICNHRRTGVMRKSFELEKRGTYFEEENFDPTPSPAAMKDWTEPKEARVEVPEDCGFGDEEKLPF